MDLERLIGLLDDGRSDAYIMEDLDISEEELEEAKKEIEENNPGDYGPGKKPNAKGKKKIPGGKAESKEEDDEDEDLDEEGGEEDDDEDNEDDDKKKMKKEAKMDDSEVLSVAKKLLKNSDDDKIKKFAQGLIDFHKKEGSFTPDQVSGLQNIMKNASFNLAKKESFDIRTNRSSVDVTKDMDALFEGESDFSDEFKNKAKDIFEAAVNSKISNELDRIEKEVEEEFQERLEDETNKLVESIDSYLNHVVEEWLTENKLAVDSGIKSNLTEEFLLGLKELFEEHHIEIPEEKVDVLEEVALEAKELEDKLDEEIGKNIEVKKELEGYKKVYILHTLSEEAELTDVEKEELVNLVENADFGDEDKYRGKIKTIIESYFKKDVSSLKESDDSKEFAGTNKDIDNKENDGKPKTYQEKIAEQMSNLH